MMKINLTILSAVKPYQGSGDGMTEYAYRLEKLLPKQGVSVSSRYALSEAKKDDIPGVIYTQTIFRMKIASIAKENRDIIHILNQEIGFAARILKGRFRGNTISTINDLSRFDPTTHTGVMQNLYNELVKKNTTEAVENMSKAFVVSFLENTRREMLVIISSSNIMGYNRIQISLQQLINTQQLYHS